MTEPEFADFPVSHVSWQDAKAYADWLGVRLPTQHEWEYVARSGSTGNYCFGDNESLLGEYGWYDENSGFKTHPVGRKNPNKWGLYDIHGNVWEFCQAVRFDYSHIWNTKGGGFMDHAGVCTVTILSGDDQQYGDLTIGFRCVRDVK
jgi:formylglycine-generating enzyme required for sulfatase activity